MESRRIIEMLQGSQLRAQRGLVVATETSNAQLARLNLGQLFRAHAKQGLVEWRSGTGKPSASLLSAITTAEHACKILPSLGGEVSEETFPLAEACGLATLVLPTSPLLPLLASSAPRAAESLLALTVAGAVHPTDFASFISAQTFPSNQTLWRETLQTYADLLLGCDPAPLVSRAELLFTQRATDPYFSGGDAMYGGGPDNTFVIDFWLASIICRTGYTGNSLHTWTGA